MDTEKTDTGRHHDHELGVEVEQSDGVYRVADNVFINKSQTNHDDALDFLQSTGDHDFTYTDKEATMVRWKIDLMMMPLLLGTYTLNFLDKGILSNASVFGLKQDTHLVGQQYSWVASIFYFGYMLGQPVNAYLLHKVPMGKWLAGNIFGWGVCILLAITAKNFAGLATTRFFLGLFESVNNPAFVLITAQYYTRKEHSLRSCIWWAGNAVGSFFGDLIAYGIGHGHGPLSPWKYMFITFGGFTVVWSAVLLLFLPDSPWKMRWLNEREKKIAVLRVMPNHTGISASHWKWNQALSVLVDPQAWIFFCISFIQCLPSGGLTAFNKLILTGLGYTNLEATIYSMPEHAIQLFAVIVACLVIVLSNIPPLVGSLIVYYVPASDKLTRLAGVYILFTNTISYIMVLSLVASNFAGMSRKTTVSAGIFLAYSAGNLVAPNLFIDKEAPLYPTGFRGMIASFVTIIVLAFVLMGYLIVQNKKRDKMYGKVDPNAVQEDDFMDLTDKELHYFRYACNLRMSLGDPRSSQKRDLPGAPRQEPSPPNVKPDVSGEPSDSQQQYSQPELSHSLPSATLNYMDLDSKWQIGANPNPDNALPQPILQPINYGLGFDSSQPSDGDLVGLHHFHISEISDFDFSFDPIFNRDIEFPSWSDAVLAVDILDYPATQKGSETSTQSASNKRYRRKSASTDAAETPQLDMTQDAIYLAHFDRWITSYNYSLKEDGKGNYLRYVLDYVQSEHCSTESPFRYAVLAWTAKHLAKISVSHDKTWKSYYVRATECLGRISCCGDSHNASETRPAPSSGQSALSSKAEITIASLLFLCRCDVLEGDATSILHRLDNFKEHLTCHLNDGPLSALACKFLLWLCYIDVRLRIFSTMAPPTYDGRTTPITTLLDALIHHPSYSQILAHSHSYASETFGQTYPSEELVQDAKKLPISVRTHETFCLISNMLQYRSWKYLAEQKVDIPIHRELAEAKEAAINLDIRRMDTEFDLARATNPAANSLCGLVTGVGHNIIDSNPTTSGIANYNTLPLTAPSSATSPGAASNDRASLQWLSCYAAFLAAKVLWSRFLYPTIRSDSIAAAASSAILKIALRLREIHRKTRLASSLKIPRSMLWPLPVFIAGIETTDEIYADWISEFIDEMDSTMNNSAMSNAAKGRVGIFGERTGGSTDDKTGDLNDQKLILMLMKRVREKQDLLGCRVDVQEVMCEIKGADDIFLL
ncbi:major facilitator superfamily domain-containing protein [Trichoderma austrokoningii]